MFSLISQLSSLLTTTKPPWLGLYSQGRSSHGHHKGKPPWQDLRFLHLLYAIDASSCATAVATASSCATTVAAALFLLDHFFFFFFDDSHKFIYGFDDMVLNLMNLMIC